MPFQRKRDWDYEWEKAPDEGREFITSISAREARTRWYLVLRDAQYGGVFVVLYHNKPIGVIGSPLIFLEILQQRHIGKSEEWHRDIEVGLEKAIRFAEAASVKTTSVLSSRTMAVSAKPKSVVMLLRDTDAIAVTYRQRRVRAFILALPVLARAWVEPAQTEQLLAWMHEVFGAIQEPMWIR
jgi:hypothetical protein